jgi:hypothetical protein
MVKEEHVLGFSKDSNEEDDVIGGRFLGTR